MIVVLCFDHKMIIIWSVNLCEIYPIWGISHKTQAFEANSCITISLYLINVPSKYGLCHFLESITYFWNSLLLRRQIKLTLDEWKLDIKQCKWYERAVSIKYLIKKLMWVQNISIRPWTSRVLINIKLAANDLILNSVFMTWSFIHSGSL